MIKIRVGLISNLINIDYGGSNICCCGSTSQGLLPKLKTRTKLSIKRDYVSILLRRLESYPIQCCDWYFTWIFGVPYIFGHVIPKHLLDERQLGTVTFTGRNF